MIFIMGLFSRNKGPKQTQLEKDLELLAAREITFEKGDLGNLLNTPYDREPPSDIRDDAEAVWHKLPKAEMDERGHWKGVAFLRKYQSGGNEIVGVSINSREVSRLTKESVAKVWDKLPDKGKVPVLCEFRMFGNAEDPRPSLDLYASKTVWAA